jgi:hypothetical protein
VEEEGQFWTQAGRRGGEKIREKRKSGERGMGEAEGEGK